MKNRKIISLALVLAVVLTLFSGTVYAFMYRQSETLENTFIPADIKCSVNEVYNENIKTSVTVTNQDSILKNRVDAYIRVKMVSYWVDDSNNIMAKSSQMPAFEIKDDWLKGQDDTYYYKKSVAPGDTTTELLNSSIQLVEEDDCRQVVVIFAEAIQAEPAAAAVAAWGVTIDSSGNITAVS